MDSKGLTPLVPSLRSAVPEDERSIMQGESFKRIQELNRQSDSITIINIGYAGKNVTSQYITGAPEHETSNLILSFLNNP
ncbi:hypothetical protein [Sulfurospirillum arcachonense]|uniref:hypothetical protein n=1 Tax=Sulfurospirillum arcachonense TaxID=57666 RepID=UPI0012EB4D50|nr:hypothetical protein [Sulfurospirillum arcachonense]